MVLDESGDDRLSRVSTIMGLAGLTAVFGMGTGVAPPVWSPESGRSVMKPTGRDESGCESHRKVALSFSVGSSFENPDRKDLT